MAAPTGRSRVLQIHPTRRCNLRCLHCYSSSGPEARETLPAELLKQAIRDAKAERYTVVSFSGGEPLMYERLPELLALAQDCRLLTTVTTNGMLLDARRISLLAGRVDLLAISLDGKPDSHNRMRAHPRGFEIMRRRLEAVRRSGMPFGFIFTLTQHNLHELPWVAEFAVESGAKLLQIHPLEAAGRASSLLRGETPDQVESGYAFLAAHRLQQALGERIRVQLDLVSQHLLQANPGQFFAAEPDDADRAAPLGELVAPLIIEPDGAVVPLQYGFSRRYALGNLNEAALSTLGERWRGFGLAPFRALCRRTFASLTTEADVPLTNWFDAIRRAGQLEAVS